MKTIKILDLCCGGGGAAMGYYRAGESFGFRVEITGVDTNPKAQKHYPFNFILGDAREWAKRAGEFDFIHASPPCQAYSKSTAKFRAGGKVYATDIIQPIRAGIETSGKPGVIENVPAAPIRPDLRLNGPMFNLNVIRVRHFEIINTFLLVPELSQVVGTVLNGDFITVIGKGGYRKDKKCPPGWRPKFDQGSGLETWRYAMGMDWGDYDTIREAIPPAYTEYIGKQLFLNFLKHTTCTPSTTTFSQSSES